jgi:L-lactate dehydrogenase complex protein LldE
VTKILEHFGCTVVFPDAQTCCGQPFYNNGFEDEARGLAQRMTGIFADYDFVVTPSGSCCAMVREHFHHLLKDDPVWAGPVEKLCKRTFEFVEFLDQVLKVNLASLKLPEPTTLTYHYTCHLRGIGIKDEGVRLLKQLGNVDFRPMEKTDQCCGFGGTFAIKYPAISGAIVQDKVNCIAATGASTTLCNDAGCTMNIAGMCHRHGVETRVRHIAELLAEALGLDMQGW